MTPDVFDQLTEHYILIAQELRSQARQAQLLSNSTAVGTEREEVYRSILERHVPKVCDVFLGGYLFDVRGNSSAQIDVIVTSGPTPRFQMSSGNRYIAPLEGTIAVAEIESQLNKDSLGGALRNCASIPPMPDSKGILAPFLKLPGEIWADIPYKIIYAYNGVSADTLYHHITEFYSDNSHIPESRRPNIIHVLEKYMIARMVPGMQVTGSDGSADSHQPETGQFKLFLTGSDASALGWILLNIQEKAFLSNHLLYKYGDWHNEVVRRIQKTR